MTADVLSIDLPWGHAAGRTAIASRSPAGGIAVATVTGDEALLDHVRARAAPGARVLLDVPLDGCEALDAARPRRPIDDRFLAIGLPILPSVKSGDRGPALAARLRALRPDLHLVEIYPYAVLRVLWALRATRRPFRFTDDASAIDLADTWRTWPPKYKRAPTRVAKLAAMRSVAQVLAELPGFRGATEPVPDDATTTELARRADRYDALLGLVAGIAAADGSSWAWLARAAGDAGSILTIADGSLRRRFAAAEARAEARSAS